jgi:hypothetical protein
MAPSGPTLIDSGACSRPTLSVPEPRLLILSSQSAPAGSHSLPRAVAWRMTTLVRADRGLHAPRATGGINNLIRRLWPDLLDKHPLHQPVIVRKTRRIIIVTNNVSRRDTIAGPGSIMWAQVQIMWAGSTRQNQSMWARKGPLLRAGCSISASRYSYRGPVGWHLNLP